MSLTFREYIASWITIWLFASLIFLLPKFYSGSVIAFAQSSTSINSSINSLPEVELIGDKNSSKRNVLGVTETVKTKHSNNPYGQYPHVAELYRIEPEKTKRLINKISEYINIYRSYGENSRVAVPVGPEIFLEVSLKYRTPLAYVVTIARLESRFGTHCYQEGRLSRICAHRNIYSMGLDDSGNNITFATWEDGVESFGSWYSKKINRGMNNCAIWKLYNPNGDYCSKVNMVADEVEQFFKE
ncbi:MAG: hypothetical protein OHK0017_10840 [Patescibacteria group bacterium]